MPAAAEFDYKAIRAALARHCITQMQLAQASNLDPDYLCRILRGRAPGELARIKIARGLAQLGLESEVRNEAR